MFDNKWTAVGRDPKDPPEEIFYIEYAVSFDEALSSIYKYIRRAEAHIIDEVVTYEDDNVFLGWNESVVSSVYIKDFKGVRI